MLNFELNGKQTLKSQLFGGFCRMNPNHCLESDELQSYDKSICLLFLLFLSHFHEFFNSADKL